MGRIFEEHLRNLQQVNERLKQAGLKLYPQKCQFLKHCVNVLLGHIISSTGIAPDPSETSKVKKGPSPLQFRKYNNSLAWKITLNTF